MTIKIINFFDLSQIKMSIRERPNPKDAGAYSEEEKPDRYGDPDSALYVIRKVNLRRSELMAKTYDKWYLKLLLLFSAFIFGYGYGLCSNLRSSYTTYALGALDSANLSSTMVTVEAVIGAASQLGYARLSDLYTRSWMLIAAIVFNVIGNVIQSQATTVARYACGAVFYQLGYDGMIILVLFILSDNSSLKWRLFFISSSTWPYIINTWISGDIVEQAKPSTGNNWKWDLAMWSFIVPLSAIPFICCQIHQWWLARSSEEWRMLNKEISCERQFTWWDRAKELFWTLDVPAAILLALVLGCILVPVDLASGVKSKWINPHILGPFVLGFVLIPFLIFWEYKFSRMPIIPWRLIKDRGIWAAMAVSFFLSLSTFIIYGQLYTLLQVGVDQSSKWATRINGLNTFTSTAFAPIFFILVTFMTRLKPVMLFGISLWFVETGLLYHFRYGIDSRAGIIAARTLGGLGTCMLTDPVNVSAMASVSHYNMATATGLCYTGYRIGRAVGSAASQAILNNFYLKKILKYGDGKIDLKTARTLVAKAPSLLETGKLKWGSDEQIAAGKAIGEVQRINCITALALMAPMLLLALIMRDPRLTHEQSHEFGRGQIVNKDDSDPIFDVTIKPLTKLFRKKHQIVDESFSDKELKSDLESTL